MPELSWALIDRLRKDEKSGTPQKSQSQVLREALALEHAYRQAIARGAEVLIREADGTEKVILHL